MTHTRPTYGFVSVDTSADSCIDRYNKFLADILPIYHRYTTEISPIYHRYTADIPPIYYRYAAVRYSTDVAVELRRGIGQHIDRHTADISTEYRPCIGRYSTEVGDSTHYPCDLVFRVNSVFHPSGIGK